MQNTCASHLQSVVVKCTPNALQRHAASMSIYNRGRAALPDENRSEGSCYHTLNETCPALHLCIWKKCPRLGICLVHNKNSAIVCALCSICATVVCRCVKEAEHGRPSSTCPPDLICCCWGKQVILPGGSSTRASVCFHLCRKHDCRSRTKPPPIRMRRPSEETVWNRSVQRRAGVWE